MTAGELLADLRGRGVTLTADGETLDYDGPSGSMRAADLAALQWHKAALVEALRREAIDPAEHRRQRVLAKLDGNPALRYALETDEARGDEVLVTLAIRDIGTCELAIPRDRYDAFEIMRLIEEHAQPESRSPT